MELAHQVKVPVTKASNLSSVHRTHMIEGETERKRTPTNCPLITFNCTMKWARAHTHTHALNK